MAKSVPKSPGVDQGHAAIAAIGHGVVKPINTSPVYDFLEQRLLPAATPDVVCEALKAIIIINGCIIDSIVLLLCLPMTMFVLGNPIPRCFYDYWHEMNQVMKPLHASPRFPVPARWAFQIVVALGGVTSPVFGLFLRLFDRDGRPRDADRGALPAVHFDYEERAHRTTVQQQRQQAWSSERWLYVNGIDTDFELALHNAECISAMVNKRVEVVYNPTHGTCVDLVECIWGRNFSLLTDVVVKLQRTVERCLHDPLVNKVCLVAHSQGSIMAFDAIRRLIADTHQHNNNDLRKLEVYTFGAATKYTPLGASDAGIFFEHHLNIFDPVACLGALWMPYGWAGKRYRYWRAGHMMNACHLIPGVHPSSRFYSKCLPGLGGKPPNKINKVGWDTLVAMSVIAGITTLSVLIVSFLLLWAYLPAGLAVAVLIAIDFR